MKEQRHQIGTRCPNVVVCDLLFASETLEDVAQEAERKDERLRDLQTKFGVTKYYLSLLLCTLMVTTGRK